MRFIRNIHNGIFGLVERLGDWLLPTLARFLFAATLFIYFWNSAKTKLGVDSASALWTKVTEEGIGTVFQVTDSMYAQILPKAAEATSWDITQATPIQNVIMLAGTWAEVILPVLIIVGLFTRYVAFGMIVFIAVQSFVDLYGHGGLDNGVLGAWFDTAPDGIILDQRFYWIFPLLYLTFRGAGPLSLDRIFSRGVREY